MHAAKRFIRQIPSRQCVPGTTRSFLPTRMILPNLRTLSLSHSSSFSQSLLSSSFSPFSSSSTFSFLSRISLFLLFILFGLGLSRVQAQENTLPGAEYDWGLTLLRDGNLVDAQKQFESELRGGFKIATERWLDSICFSAMLGETQYQMGHYAEALENFNTTVRLSIQYGDWLTQVQNLPNPGMFTLKPVPWGDPNPSRGLMHVPDKFSIMFGDINYGSTYRTGGVAMPPTLRSIRGGEIVRCTMLALRRRAELLGPLGAGDELNAQLITRLTQTQRALAGNWLQAWLETELGLCYLAAGKTDEAMQSLMKGSSINGMAHPMTPIAYIELGKLQIRSANYEKAYNLFLEAVTIAFYYEDVESMTEAFTWLENAYCQRNPRMTCPPLTPAAEWARIKKLPVLYTTLQLLRTDDFMRFHQVRPALECLATAEKTLKNRTAAGGRLGAELNWQRARLAFLDPAPNSQQAGMMALMQAMRFMQFGGIWNFQINLVDTRLLNAQITSRKAMEAYFLLLREPTTVDWALTPMEAMAVTMTPRLGTWENYFLCAIDMEKKEDALEISEKARRAAYLQSLDFGGRLHSMRLLLECPEVDLTITQRQRRRDLLTEYPEYAHRSQKIRELQTKIRQMSLPVTEENQETVGVELTEALNTIAKLSQEQEAILNAIVLERRLIDIVFPKVRTYKEIQASLPKGEAMLIYFVARNQLFLFLTNNERLAMWKIVDSGSGAGSSRSRKKGKASENTLTSLQTNFTSLLGEFGLGAGKIQPQSLLESNWKAVSQRVMADLTKNSQANFASADFTSLIIVPDRFTWYIPFEALQIQTSKGLRPTISQFAVRYAPMASLGTPWKQVQLPKSPYSMIVAGKAQPGEKTFTKFKSTLERPVLFEAQSYGGIQPGTTGATSSILAPEFDKMLVFADLNNDESASYTLFPMGLDYGKKEGSLGYWFLLPHGAPRLVVLSGMRTQGENFAKKSGKKSSASAKRGNVGVPGQEFFLTSMAFLANGTDTIILPRWRLEGTSPWLLTSTFLEQLPKNENSAFAWRKAILNFAGAEIRIKTEPKIAKSDEITRVSASHPLFWAGFVLIDSGSGSLQSKERLASADEESPEMAPLPVAPEVDAVPDAPPALVVPPPATGVEGPTETDENSENVLRRAPATTPAQAPETAPARTPAATPNSGNGPLAPLPPMGGQQSGTSTLPMSGAPQTVSPAPLE